MEIIWKKTSLFVSQLSWSPTDWIPSNYPHMTCVNVSRGRLSVLHAFQLQMCETQRNKRQDRVDACQTPLCKALWTKRNTAWNSQFLKKSLQWALQWADVNSAAVLTSLTLPAPQHVGVNLWWTRMLLSASACRSAMSAMRSGDVGFFVIIFLLTPYHVHTWVKEKTQILLFSPHQCTFYILPLNSAFISVAWHCLWVENNILSTRSADSLGGVWPSYIPPYY